MIDNEAQVMVCDECDECIESYYHVIDDNMDKHYCRDCAINIADERLYNQGDISIDTYSVECELRR